MKKAINNLNPSRQYHAPFRSTLLPILMLAILIVTGRVPRGLAEDQAAYDRSADQHRYIVFMQEGGWCWYQDPRAILHNGKLFIGAAQGNGSGDARVGIFDLKLRKQLGTVTLHAEFDHDDHNCPVFYARPDGSVLAIYARHNRDRFHYSRWSQPGNPLKWSKEIRHEQVMPNANDKVTYMNLHELKNEKKLYLFFRGINFNPTFVTSEDHGRSWSQPVHFFEDEIGGRHRPYACYAGNGKDTIHVCITDAHPRDFGNSIYYFAFRQGSYFRADGKLIKHLQTGGPLHPSEVERIYQGSGKPGRGVALSAPNAAWTSSIAVDRDGHPHIGYTVYLSNTDHRYRIASWNGHRWIDREVAYGGKCLYDRESSYTGLITLDPVDPRFALISTDVNPGTGKNDGGLHEIYRAIIGPNNDIKSIKWLPVTKDSPVRNIRPIIIRDGQLRVMMWNRGDFRTYTNYQLDTVGLIETVKN